MSNVPQYVEDILSIYGDNIVYYMKDWYLCIEIPNKSAGITIEINKMWDALSFINYQLRDE